jgi:hypothetical protein
MDGVRLGQIVAAVLWHFEVDEQIDGHGAHIHTNRRAVRLDARRNRATDGVIKFHILVTSVLDCRAVSSVSVSESRACSGRPWTSRKRHRAN